MLDHGEICENDIDDGESLNEDQNSISESMTSSSRPSKKIPFDEGTSSSCSSQLMDDSSQKSMSQPSPAAVTILLHLLFIIFSIKERKSS